MIRISKIADYGTKILLMMAEHPEALYSAAGLAEGTQVSAPTVSKILKILVKSGLLHSQRGSQGGYQLARSPSEISLADIVNVLDGNIAMTDCDKGMGCCELEANCNVKDNWSLISQVIQDVLQGISLQQMSHPLKQTEIPVKFYPRVAQ